MGLRGSDRKWTNEGGQGGERDHKRNALRSRRFSKTGVMLRHSRESGTEKKQLEGTNRDMGSVVHC